MKQVRRAVLFLWVFALMLSSAASAEEKRGYTLAVVPQSQISDIFERWTPFLKRLSREAGVEITLQPYGTFKTFEEAVLVVKSTENISTISRENLKAVEQMAKSSEGLVEAAKALMQGVASFKA